MRLLIFALALCLLSGCASQSPDGSVRRVIIGVGWVSIQAPTDGPAIIRTKAIGAVAGGSRVAAGLIQTTEAFVPANSTNVVLELR